MSQGPECFGTCEEQKVTRRAPRRRRDTSVAGAYPKPLTDSRPWGSTYWPTLHWHTRLSKTLHKDGTDITACVVCHSSSKQALLGSCRAWTDVLGCGGMTTRTVVYAYNAQHARITPHRALTQTWGMSNQRTSLLVLLPSHGFACLVVPGGTASSKHAAPSNTSQVELPRRKHCR
jgi:hypothetical protein